MGSTQREFFIKLLIKMLNIRGIEAVNFFLVKFDKSCCKKIISSFKNLKSLDYYSIVEFVEKSIDRIERELKINPLNKLLPMRIRIEEVLRIINLEQEMKLFREVEFHNVKGKQLAYILKN